MSLYSSMLFVTLASAIPSPYAGYSGRVGKRAANSTQSSLEIDLGYAIYEGWRNESAQLNVFQGYDSAKEA